MNISLFFLNIISRLLGKGMHPDPKQAYDKANLWGTLKMKNKCRKQSVQRVTHQNVNTLLSQSRLNYYAYTR